MGSQFFQKAIGHPSPVSGGNLNPMAKAISTGGYAARGSAIAEQKALGGAQGAFKAAMSAANKPNKQSGAYPKGPKI
jgi:hypothetical protein